MCEALPFAALQAVVLHQVNCTGAAPGPLGRQSMTPMLSTTWQGASCSLFAPAVVHSLPRLSWRPVRSSSQQDADTSKTFEYTYKGSDGRLKATFEQAFKGSEGAAPVATSSAPWSLGYQMSEAGIMWSDDLKARLIKRVVADQLHVSEGQVEERLRQLSLLMPALQQKLPGMKPQLLARLAANVPAVAAAMLELKDIFPEADVSLLALREPVLVLGFDMARLRAIAAELRELLPRLNVDRLVEENPSMLDVVQFKLAMQEAKRIMPSLDIQQALGSDPQIVFGFQRGSQLIPYDEPGKEKDDDEYSSYYQW